MDIKDLPSITSDDVLFNQLMEEVDFDMRSNGVAIPARSIEAICAVSKRYRCAISWNDTLAKRINAWFQDRYGDRLKVSFDIGSTVVEIKGDLYAVSLPLILGTYRVNILEWIKGVTPGLLHALSESELNEIGSHIFEHYQAYSEIKFLPNDCIPDLKIAVHQLVERPPQYGLSRWASLQAVEKTLKAYIKKMGGNAPSGGKNGHNLMFLAQMAESFQLPSIDNQLIAQSQCSPSVRYEESSSTQDDAYHAYCAAIKICRNVALKYPKE
jgi:hypothetical protein